MEFIRWEQNVKNKKGSFSDRRFENGGQCGRTSIYLSLHRVPKDVGSMNKISPPIPILSIPISLEEGAASSDIIFPSLPWSSLFVGTRDHFHKNAFGKTHVAHSANTTKPGQLWFSDAIQWCRTYPSHIFMECPPPMLLARCTERKLNSWLLDALCGAIVTEL